MKREGWVAVVQDEDGAEETEIVTIEGGLTAGGTIETTDGRRITLLEPAGTSEKAAAA